MRHGSLLGPQGLRRRGHDLSAGSPRLLGRYDDAETHLRDALAMHQRMQAPYWIARTQLDLAELSLARQGPTDAATARELIQQAQRGIADYGYGGLQPQADRLLQRL